MNGYTNNCKFNVRVICFAALTLGLALTPANPAVSLDESFLYTSSVSPDGAWIAENFGTNGCCGGGFVLIHKISEPSTPSDAVIFSASTAPGLFMIWQDNKNLLLVQDANDEPVHGPSSYREITISYSKYQNRIIDRHTFDVANISKISLGIRDTNVGASTTEQKTGVVRRCKLSINARDGIIYNQIGLRIEADVVNCGRASGCARISSEFWVANRIDGRYDIALTSATASDIPSVNRGPYGVQNNEAKGGFYGNSATDLMVVLSSGSFDLEYSLNFFDTIISYHLPSQRIASSINSFKTCVGDADFNGVAPRPPPLTP